MTTKRVGSFVCIALSSALVWSSCGRGPSSEETKLASTANATSGGLVGPLKDDSSNDILSWVDGQVVSDWSAEIAKRDRAIDGSSQRHRLNRFGLLTVPGTTVTMPERTGAPLGGRI